MTLSDWANFATILGAAAAAGAIVFGVWQIRIYRLQQIEAIASDHYQDFLRLSMENPDFAKRSDQLLDPIKGTFDASQEKFIQYDCYLWVGLNALESLYFTLGRRNLSWRATIASILDDHKKSLASKQVGQYSDTFEPEFREFLQPWLAGSGSLSKAVR